jgi:Amt family ammonium transporter
MKRYVPFTVILIALALTFLFPSVEVDKTATATYNTGDTAWMLMSTALVLIMTPGLAFFYGGMVNKKNVISTMLQSVVCMVIITVMWGVFGFSLAFGDSIGGIIGNPSTFFMMKGMLSNNTWPLAPTIPLLLQSGYVSTLTYCFYAFSAYLYSLL